MNTKIIRNITLLFLMILLSVFIIIRIEENKIFRAENSSEKNYAFTINNLHNGDAKFYDNNHILTNINGKLTVINFDGTILQTYDDINVNWLSVEPESKTVIYCNSQNQTGILQFDKSFNIIKNEIINTNDNLAIDPTIIKIDDTYYITYTTINGTVNNSDITKENGTYTVELYSSKDLSKWQFIENVIYDKHNIEDIVPYYANGLYYLFFERELLDKAESSLEVIVSTDKGYTWTSPKTLCNPDADNELGNIFLKNDTFIIYYSSDRLNKGSSYEGANIFVSYYDKAFNLIEETSQIEPYSSTLLYDVYEDRKNLYLLYTEKYITESNLILIRLKKY